MKIGDPPVRPNILFLITDQQRAFQHWPEGWAEKNLPSFKRLQEHGLTFHNAFTNTSMCSPSRATFWTSTFPPFPPENGVLSTGGTLDLETHPYITTMGQVLTKAGYEIVYCGKWHLGNDPQYAGFGTSWDPPDAGTSLSPGPTQGAGAYNNDARFLGTVTGDQENPKQTGNGPSVLEFLSSYDGSAPFFLVASFVNPHDVFVGPNQVGVAGYDPCDWENLEIPVPGTWDEDLATKPAIQAWFRKNYVYGDPTTWTDAERKSYAQFYAYLQTLIDKDIQTLLDKLDETGLTGNTLIFRFSDHGEMGLSHGLLEKTLNAYEETIHVPLIVSNPQLFPEPKETQALAGLIDLLPTVASVAGVLDQFRQQLRGIDLTPLFSRPDGDLQDYVHFTYDDVALGPPPDTEIPWQIRALREKDWLYAVYFLENGSAFDFELYDLRSDPGQTKNLANPVCSTPESQKELDRLNQKLIDVMKENGTMPKLPPGVSWPVKPQIK